MNFWIRLFDFIFHEKLGGCLTSCKKQITTLLVQYVVQAEKIDPEVTDVLDAILDVANKAKPLGIL